MTWRWRLESEDGTDITGPDPATLPRAVGAPEPTPTPLDSPSHPNQSDAESWLGERWRDLADAGVASVTLLEDDRTVYGPMSLAEG